MKVTGVFAYMVTAVSSSSSSSWCNMPGEYMDESEHHWFSFINGDDDHMVKMTRHKNGSGRTIECQFEDETLQCDNGTTGTYHKECKVIAWSSAKGTDLGFWVKQQTSWAKRSSASSECNVPSEYIDESKHHWFSVTSGDDWVKMAEHEDGSGNSVVCQFMDGTLQCIDGTTGTYKNKCNVIAWSSGSVWTKEGSFVAFGCTMGGEYVDESKHHWSVAYSGDYFVTMEDGSAHSVDCQFKDGTLQCDDGTKGTYQSKCDVIAWSSGAVWTKEQAYEVSV